jgi:regulatory subunit for Cdc7p protein kinase
MEDGQSRARAATPTDIFNPARAAMSKAVDARPQNAFTSRAAAGRLFAGEPVASGVQPSNITSAIRSQMVSSTSGINGAKAGTSKEVHGLQRKVLQKAAPASFDVSSRRLAEVSMDVASSRSTTMGRHTSRPAEVQEEDAQKTERRTQSQPLKSKRDLKPGYCENCQDKFRDFDEVCDVFFQSMPVKTNFCSTFYLANTGSLLKTTKTGLSLILSCHKSRGCPSTHPVLTRRKSGSDHS